jgi:signal transduction histidine kinase
VLEPWRHASTWWALTHLSTAVVVGIVALALVGGLLVATGALLVTVVLVVPAAWLLFVASRGLGRFERVRLAALLDVVVADPIVPLTADRWWRRVLERATSLARWKEIGYLVLLGPLSIITGLVAFAAWCGALALLFLPAYVSELPDGTAKLYFVDVGRRESVVAALVGAVGVLVIAPWATVLLGRLHVATGRRLLGPDPRAEQEERVRRAESGRAAALSSAEAERRRIERDLHDGAQQRLVALALDLGVARERYDRDPEAVRVLIARAHDEAKAALGELRDLVRGIHPVVLDNLGLDAALSGVVARASIPVLLEVDVEPRVPDVIESTAYFVVSEALTNVARHSGATNAAVSVVRAGEAIVVEIRDNGVGGADADRGTGLDGLADRVTSVGGTLDVTSPQGGPTVVRAVLPCG